MKYSIGRLIQRLLVLHATNNRHSLRNQVAYT